MKEKNFSQKVISKKKRDLATMEAGKIFYEFLLELQEAKKKSYSSVLGILKCNGKEMCITNNNFILKEFNTVIELVYDYNDYIWNLRIYNGRIKINNNPYSVKAYFPFCKTPEAIIGIIQRKANAIYTPGDKKLHYTTVRVNDNAVIDFHFVRYVMTYTIKPKIVRKYYLKNIIKILKNSVEKKLTVSEIYRHFINKDSFSQQNAFSWQNCIRHFLSQTSYFVNVPRNGNDDLEGNENYWMLEEKEYERIMTLENEKKNKEQKLQIITNNEVKDAKNDKKENSSEVTIINNELPKKNEINNCKTKNTIVALKPSEDDLKSNKKTKKDNVIMNETKEIKNTDELKVISEKDDYNISDDELKNQINCIFQTNGKLQQIPVIVTTMEDVMTLINFKLQTIYWPIFEENFNIKKTYPINSNNPKLLDIYQQKEIAFYKNEINKKRMMFEDKQRKLMKPQLKNNDFSKSTAIKDNNVKYKVIMNQKPKKIKIICDKTNKFDGKNEAKDTKKIGCKYQEQDTSKDLKTIDTNDNSELCSKHENNYSKKTKKLKKKIKLDK